MDGSIDGSVHQSINYSFDQSIVNQSINEALSLLALYTGTWTYSLSNVKSWDGHDQSLGAGNTVVSA